MVIERNEMAYTCKKGVMSLSHVELSTKDRESLKKNLKIGIYKELHSKELLTNSEFQILAEKQRKHKS